MRHIQLDKLRTKIPTDWLQRASNALKEICDTPPSQRAKAINAQQKIWKDLKDTLIGASDGKCWYCESIDKRSDNAVDHFRPKNRVAEAVDPNHGGYWWLAFDWRNYRFTCTLCNSNRNSGTTSGGKQDHFPLWCEKNRAAAPEDPIEDEQPMLLDPTLVKDVGEIIFGDDGKAEPAESKEENLYRFERARQSIKLYHLNHPTIVEFRAHLMWLIRGFLEDADKFLKKSRGGDPTAEAAYESRLSDVYRALQSAAEYSAAVRATVGSLRGTYRSAEILLMRVL